MFFGSYAEALEAAPDDAARARLALALIDYGSWGIEPTFAPEEWGLELGFRAMRKNLDISVQHYIDGKKGGRPRKYQLTTFEPEVGSQMAKAAEICQEPIPDEVIEAQAAYMSDEWERKHDLMRAEIEASEWVG